MELVDTGNMAGNSFIEKIDPKERQMDGILEGTDFVDLVSGHFGECRKF